MNNGYFERKDISNERHEKLVAIKPVYRNKRGEYVWLCKCDCGNEIELTTAAFRNNKTCGCSHKERNIHNGKKSIKIINEKYYKDNTNLAYIKSNKLSKRNSSGVKGVYWSEHAGKWRVEIRCQGKRHHIGYFDDLNIAENARQLAEKEFFKPIIDQYVDEFQDGDN